MGFAIIMFEDEIDEDRFITIRYVLVVGIIITLIVGLLAKYLYAPDGGYPNAELVGTICITAAIIQFIILICTPFLKKARRERREKRKKEDYEKHKEEREAWEKQQEAKRQAQEERDKTCNQCHQVTGRWIRKEEWHSRQISKYVRPRPYQNLPPHYVFGVEYEEVDVYQCSECHHIWHVSRGWQREWNEDIVR